MQLCVSVLVLCAPVGGCSERTDATVPGICLSQAGGAPRTASAGPARDTVASRADVHRWGSVTAPRCRDAEGAMRKPRGSAVRRLSLAPPASRPPGASPVAPSAPVAAGRVESAPATIALVTCVVGHCHMITCRYTKAPPTASLGVFARFSKLYATRVGEDLCAGATSDAASPVGSDPCASPVNTLQRHALQGHVLIPRRVGLQPRCGDERCAGAALAWRCALPALLGEGGARPGRRTLLEGRAPQRSSSATCGQCPASARQGQARSSTFRGLAEAHARAAGSAMEAARQDRRAASEGACAREAV